MDSSTFLHLLNPHNYYVLKLITSEFWYISLNWYIQKIWSHSKSRALWYFLCQHLHVSKAKVVDMTGEIGSHFESIVYQSAEFGLYPIWQVLGCICARVRVCVYVCVHTCREFLKHIFYKIRISKIYIWIYSYIWI